MRGGRTGPSEVMANVAENNRKDTTCLLRKESARQGTGTKD